MGWSAHPDAEDGAVTRRRLEHALGPSVEQVGDSVDGPVVSLGAVCAIDVDRTDDPDRQSFDVGEFAVLGDGRRILLHAERGWSTSTNGDDVWERETVETLRRTVLAVVLPDDAEETLEEHDFEWLSELLAQRGVTGFSHRLKHLPYEVVLSREILDRVAGGPD